MTNCVVWRLTWLSGHLWPRDAQLGSIWCCRTDLNKEPTHSSLKDKKRKQPPYGECDEHPGGWHPIIGAQCLTGYRHTCARCEWLSYENFVLVYSMPSHNYPLFMAILYPSCMNELQRGMYQETWLPLQCLAVAYTIGFTNLRKLWRGTQYHDSVQSTHTSADSQFNGLAQSSYF